MSSSGVYSHRQSYKMACLFPWMSHSHNRDRIFYSELSSLINNESDFESLDAGILRRKMMNL